MHTLDLGLERWSNGCFRATLHAVVNESRRERISLPFFYETNIDATIEPAVATTASRRASRRRHLRPTCWRDCVPVGEPCDDVTQ